MPSALAAPNVHVVFSAECNHALTWQSVGIFHSHKAVNQPGPITRLLACSDEQLQTYRGMDIGPTFVHHNMRFGHPLIDEVGYPSYNKPASVMFWLDQVDVKEEFIALLDTDMQLREPLDPVALGARRGVVVSAEYAYLVGTKGKFVRRFLEAEEEPLAAQCGGFHIFHREDLRVIAPLWVEFTKRVRAFAKEDMETYCSESFLNWHQTEGVSASEIETRRHQALWQAEMYGYAFGAARANVSHIVRGDTMLYPGYEPRAGLMPTILHYGSDYTIANEEGGSLISPKHGRSTYFNKMGHKELDLYACRGHNEATARGALFFFDAPPPIVTAEGKPRSKRDLLITQHLQLLNAAFCAFYTTHCGAQPADCPAERATHAGISQALQQCVDGHESCSAFAARGECLNNPNWMMSTCARSCDTCGAARRPQLRALLGTVARHGPLVPVPAPDALGQLLRRHERRRQGRATMQRLAMQHGCGEVCSFFGVRVRYGRGHATPLDQGEGECAAGEGEGAAGEGGRLPRQAAGAASAAGGGGTAGMLPHRLSGAVGVAEFGAGLDCLGFRAPLRLGESDGCNYGFVPYSGTVVLLPRGGCSFVRKAMHMQASGAVGLLIYDPDGAAEQLFTLADDGNGSAVRIPVLLLPHASATLLRKAVTELAFEILARRRLKDEASPEGAGQEEEEELLVEIEGMELTVRAEEEDVDEPGVEAVAGSDGGSPMGTAVKCHAGSSGASDAVTDCIRQHPVDPWSIEDSMWDALRCSTSG